jgi:pyridoxine 5-phosphate synthase
MPCSAAVSAISAPTFLGESIKMAYLGVNVDHVATVRQARQTYEPDPIAAAAIAQQSGADVITIHLREDRRHIQDRDLHVMRETVFHGLNLEISCEPEIIAIACKTRPDQATLVPERREEVTTEGGLDVAGDRERVGQAIERLQESGISVSLFIDPVQEQIEASKDLGAQAVELHTGAYALADDVDAKNGELQRLLDAGKQCHHLGMRLHAGHGLNYHNVLPVAAIPNMRELNIGHSIIARAIFVGLAQAVREMREIINQAGYTAPCI